MNEHLISEFQQLGVDEKSAVLALQVYLELCEVKKYWDVTYEYNSQIEKIVLRAKKKPSEANSLFIPLPSYEDLSFLKMQTFLDITNENSLFLAIVHPDSTCVYYQIANDLLEPTDTMAKHLKVNKRDKLDADLKKNRKFIEQAALLGVPVTISREKDKKEPTKEGV